MLQTLFARPTHAPWKRYVEIGEGTHTIIMEKNRMQLFQEVQQFLDERLQPNPQPPLPGQPPGIEEMFFHLEGTGWRQERHPHM